MSSTPADVAIVGMACVFPGAPDLRGYWDNIVGGVDAITDPPPGYLANGVLDPGSTANDRLYTQRGGYLGDLARFNPFDFGVMPRAVDGSEPEHFIALRLCHDALADAGYLDRPFNRRATGVILGRGTYVNRGLVSCFQHTIVVDQVIELLHQLHPEHPAEYLEELKRSLKDGLPPFNPETAAGLAHSVMCGRVANRLDLMGPAFSVDAACASTLIAVELGIGYLQSRTCDMVLAGGIQISTTYPIAMLFSQLGALARSGKVRPFHPDADGTLLGEGAGVVALKRREDAERDGDRVYAVIKGVGTASDGRAMGLLAPRVDGEELAMRRAYEASGIDPRTIDLVEAHGTGTPVGDATEAEALRRVFADDAGPCAMGSVKSMIGHCIPAAAAASLIKTALALHHKVLPPTLHAEEPHAKLAGGRFYLSTQTRPWIHAAEHPRRAGLNAFGFGGINAHVILEEASPAGGAEAPRVAVSRRDGDRHRPRDSELFVVSGADRGDLAARAGALRRFLAARGDATAWDVAYSLNCPEPKATGRRARLALVATSLDELERKLAWAVERLEAPDCERIREKSGIHYTGAPLGAEGGLAFLFPGEGAQYPGMLADICLSFPEARGWFDLMDRAFRGHHRGVLPSQVVFPVPGSGMDDASRRIFEMDSAIESVFAANQAMHAVLTGLGVRPDAVVGHSTGEYSALLAAGAARVESEEEFVEHILDGNSTTERAIRDGLVPAGMLLAVGPVRPEMLRGLTNPEAGVYLAMDNCPHQAVLCGTPEAIARVEKDLRDEGAVCQRLPFERAYHTPLFAPVCEELRGFYDRARLAGPRVPLYSCVTAAPMPDDPDEVRRLAREQWARPVRFRETIEAMYAAGIRVFVEVGPRGNLTAFVEDILRGRPFVATASNVQRRSGITQLHHLLAVLAAHGVPLSLDMLYESRGAGRIPEDVLTAGASAPPRSDKTLPLARALPSLRAPESLRGRPAGSRAETPRPAPAPPPPALLPATPQPAPALPPTPKPPPAPPGNGAEAATVMSEYLRTMERFLETEGEVMRAVLGVATPPPTTPTGRPPFVGSVTRRGSDGTVVVRRMLSFEAARFLLDHTLGDRVSEDPSLRALPILPLAMSLEAMAEAALVAAPGLEVVGLRDVKTHRWVPFADPQAWVEIVATPGDGGEVAVRLLQIEDPDSPGEGTLTVEGVVLTASSYPAPPHSSLADLRGPRPSRWTGSQLYAAGTLHGMFHGPAFQGVESVDGIGPEGAEATLRSTPTSGLFRSHSSPAFVLDPLVLDAASQVLGYWTAESLERQFVVFPVRFDRLDVFGPGAPPSARRQCQMRCALAGDDRIRADFEVLDPDGRVHARISGWEVKRVGLPEDVYAFRLSPREVLLSTPVAPPVASDPAVQCCRLEVSPGFLEADGGIWKDGLAHLVLSRSERETWRAMRGAEKRRIEWLLGRIAAKDAVRLFLRHRHRLSVFPADVEITVDSRGRPGVEGPWLREVGAAPAVSLSHSRGIAVAIACSDRSGGGVGVDVERLRVTDPGFESVAFTDDERRLLGGVGDERRDEWRLRLWCAKEAVAKALGQGLMGDPRNLVASEIDTRAGTVRLDVAGKLFDALPDGSEPSRTAFTGRDGEIVIATAV